MAEITGVDNSICNECQLRESCFTATYGWVVLTCGKKNEYEHKDDTE